MGSTSDTGWARRGDAATGDGRAPRARGTASGADGVDDTSVHRSGRRLPGLHAGAPFRPRAGATSSRLEVTGVTWQLCHAASAMPPSRHARGRDARRRLSAAATPTSMPIMSIRRRYYAYSYAYAPRPTGRDRWRMRG
ncbi:hypothetical protein rosag_42160 [Roseisolibacter agri]|uniref:Uncharacterized protein n=1 Tax=Roseisolibacter agri TaxID=2014610 RepID=A0AA37VCI4_9BACT|nr:hypothetical protein rosag_42160 [Roseisolibacter agri]